MFALHAPVLIYRMKQEGKKANDTGAGILADSDSLLYIHQDTIPATFRARDGGRGYYINSPICLRTINHWDVSDAAAVQAVVPSI
jgi:hypothetical protein